MAIFTAIASLVAAASSFFAGLSVIGAFVLQTAAGIGLNLLAKALAGEPEKPTFSVQGKLQSGGDVPRSFPVGYTATAGSLVYSNEWGASSKTPNAYHVQVIAVSDLPIASLAEVWVNGEKVTIDSTAHPDYGFPVLEYRDDDKDFLWIKFYDGNQTVADPYLVSKFSASERPYQSTRVGRGVAYVICTSRVHEELFTGFPQFKFAVNGIKLYDPSKDSTVGGTGAHRWNDRSTWGGDGDHLPAVQVYNLLRGITFAGQWVYGLQSLPAARLPVAHWISQIGKCRVSNATTGNKPIYRAGGEIQVNAQISEAIGAMLTSCQGRLPEIGGTYKIYVGAPGAAVFAFDDDDIVSTAEQSFTPFFGLADTINGIAAKYPSPDEGWNTKVAPPLYNAQFEAEDGKRRLMADVSLDFVPYDAQVQRLISSALEEARRARRHTHVLPPSYWGVEPGDIMSWSSVRNGYVNKLFRVDGVVDDANLDVMVDLTEVDPSDYDWDQAVDYRTPTSGFVGKPYPPVQPMQGWAVAPDVVTDETGTSRRPAIRISCAADQDDVQRVHVQVRVKATASVVFDSDATAYASPFSWLLSGGWTLPATVYQARGKFVPYSARKTDWSAWLDVTTPDVRISIDDLTQDILDKLTELDEWISEDLLNKVNQTISDLNDAVEKIDQEEQDRIDGAIEAAGKYRALLNEIESIRDYVANADYAGYTAREEIRRTITTRLESSIATFDERITTAV
ncbi:MAG TPA: phage tail protein, partial [Pararhizobium sp.]|uniref:phage tail protein n=1 Tax=Pararhizobium sp. TaxID=1977563 RepID=UPI002C515FB3